jgi:hypothetical protein
LIVPEKRSKLKNWLLAKQLHLTWIIYRSPGKILLGVLAVSVVSMFFTFKLFQDVRTDCDDAARK